MFIAMRHFVLPRIIVAAEAPKEGFSLEQVTTAQDVGQVAHD